MFRERLREHFPSTALRERETRRGSKSLGGAGEGAKVTVVRFPNYYHLIDIQSDRSCGDRDLARTR